MTEPGIAGRTRSITVRLAATIALILAAGGVAISIAAYAYGRQAAQEAYDRLLAGAAFQIAQSVTIIEGHVVVNLPVSAFELLALAPDDRVFYRVIGPDGATITGYDDLPSTATAKEDLAFYSADYSGEAVRLASAVRRFAERGFSGQVQVVVGHTTRARAALARDITTKALVLVAGAGLALVALVAFAVRTSLGPLVRIEQALRSRDPKDLSPLTVSTPREVEAIVAAINRFMSRLSSRVTVMQNLIADATHQLKTPIAAVRAQAELAIEEPDPARLRTIARRIHGRAVGLSRLADQLLNQALIIHRSDAAAQEVIDLREVAIRATDETDHDLLSSGLDLHLELPEHPVHARGDALSLVEATKNLLSNALRYGTPPVWFSVEHDHAKGTAEFAVTDCGPGIPESDWKDSGRRFARSAGSSPDSAGLGLAIVNAVAEAHRGHLTFSRTAEGRFRVTLAVPAEQDGSQ
ncbi:MAG TPA: sensor histidine kinase N-terminal domain-containing protein [Dongiaceae bacterium]|nr:sensor histidine kinase N-terminal domain-containing protein [Dongiaceae bacterium]